MTFNAYKRKQKSGFTLVELMVVLVIMGIMAAMMIPEMRGTYENALLRSSSQQWMDVMGLAYSRAVTMNQAHRVRLDRRLNEFFVERHVSSGGDRDGFVPVEDGSSRGKIDPRITVKFRAPMEASDGEGQQVAPASPEDQTTEQPDEKIEFYPDGTADAREIILQDQGGFRLALRINPTTARVQVVELPHQ
jgi:type II secretion system protein H